MRNNCGGRFVAVSVALLVTAMAQTTSYASIVIDDFRSPVFEDVIHSDTGMGEIPLPNTYSYVNQSDVLENGTRRWIILGSMSVGRNRPEATTKLGIREVSDGEFYVDSDIFAETFRITWQLQSPLDLTLPENSLLQIKFGTAGGPDTSEFRMVLFPSEGEPIASDYARFSSVSNSDWSLDLTPMKAEHDLSDIESFSFTSLGFTPGSAVVVREFRVVPEPTSLSSLIMAMGGVLFAGQHRRDLNRF